MSHRVYVGTIGEGVWRSLDSGETFARAADGMFVECHVRALTVHPGDDRLLYIGTEQGLFRSGDGASNWQRVAGALDGQQIWSVLIPPRQPDMLLVGTCPSRIYQSSDTGRSWREGRTDMIPECPRIMHTRVTTLKADPDDDQVFWAGVEIDGIHQSRDGGGSWQRHASTGLVSQDIHDLLFLN